MIGYDMIFDWMDIDINAKTHINVILMIIGSAN